jgi:hypothetical protein
MTMDPRQRPARAGRSRFRTVADRLLRLPVPSADMRVVDLVVLPVAALIAIVVAIPILIVTTVAAYGLFSGLTAVGVPQATASAVIPILGFGGGLVVVAVVLLRISRRLPAAIRSLVYEDDAEEPAIRPRAGDPDADPTTFVERVAAADATLAPGQPGTGASEPSAYPTRDGPSPP